MPKPTHYLAASEPDLTTVLGIAREAEEVYRRLQRGQMTSREANAALALLERMTRLSHTLVLERRVASLEKYWPREKMKKTLDHLYEKLTVTERFQAFMQAMGESDIDALERLNETCPEGSYRGKDLRYSLRKTLFLMLSFFAMAELRQAEHMVSLRVIGLLKARGSDSALDSSESEDQLIETVSRGLARLAGWEAFCAEIKVPPWAALEMMQVKPLVFFDSIRELAPDLSAIEPAEDQIAAEQTMWRTMWQSSIDNLR